MRRDDPGRPDFLGQMFKYTYNRHCFGGLTSSTFYGSFERSSPSSVRFYLLLLSIDRLILCLQICEMTLLPLSCIEPLSGSLGAFAARLESNYLAWIRSHFLDLFVANIRSVSYPQC